MFFVWMHSSADLRRVTTKTDVFIPYVEVMYIKINYAFTEPDTLTVDLLGSTNINLNKIIRMDPHLTQNIRWAL